MNVTTNRTHSRQFAGYSASETLAETVLCTLNPEQFKGKLQQTGEIGLDPIKAYQILQNPNTEHIFCVSNCVRFEEQQSQHILAVMYGG
jgi:hypothetical protein